MRNLTEKKQGIENMLMASLTIPNNKENTRDPSKDSIKPLYESQTFNTIQFFSIITIQSRLCLSFLRSFSEMF